MLGPNIAIAKHIKRQLGNSLASNTLCTVRTSRRRSYNQRVGCLQCSMAMIYDLRDGGLWTSARCVGLVHCCGKDSYQAQVP